MKNLKHLKFREPQNLDDALLVVTTMSVFLDFWIGRTEDWQFVQLIAKSVDLKIWNVLSKCVVTKSNISIEDVSFEELGTSGVLEALTVFSKGLMELELPEIYLNYCAGITTKATIDLIKDANRIKEELKDIPEPTNLVASLISKALAGSL